MSAVDSVHWEWFGVWWDLDLMGYDCRIYIMALVSQAGGSYTVPSGPVCSKTGTKAGFGGVRNLDVLRMKEASVSSYSRSLSTKSMLLNSSNSVKKSKRGHGLIVAASPPTEEAVVATEPLTREDLIAYLASGCKTKDKWRYSLIPMYSVKMPPIVSHCDIFA